MGLIRAIGSKVNPSLPLLYPIALGFYTNMGLYDACMIGSYSRLLCMIEYWDKIYPAYISTNPQNFPQSFLQLWDGYIKYVSQTY